MLNSSLKIIDKCYAETTAGGVRLYLLVLTFTLTPNKFCELADILLICWSDYLVTCSRAEINWVDQGGAYSALGPFGVRLKKMLIIRHLFTNLWVIWDKNNEANVIFESSSWLRPKHFRQIHATSRPIPSIGIALKALVLTQLPIWLVVSANLDKSIISAISLSQHTICDVS